MHIEGLVLDAGLHKAVVVAVRALAVYQHAVRHPEVLPLVQHLPQILQKPLTSKTSQAQPYIQDGGMHWGAHDYCYC